MKAESRIYDTFFLRIFKYMVIPTDIFLFKMKNERAILFPNGCNFFSFHRRGASSLEKSAF